MMSNNTTNDKRAAADAANGATNGATSEAPKEASKEAPKEGKAARKDARKSTPPKAEAPKAEAPKVEAPKAEAPKEDRPREGLRLRMKVWTDPTTSKRYLMPSAVMTDLRFGAMTAYAMSDEDTKVVKLTAIEWNALPFFYFQEDGPAPRRVPMRVTVDEIL